MPAPSAIDTLPPKLREELDQMLIARRFTGYTELAEWMEQAGYTISRSALHRHGQLTARRIEQVRIATESAQALMAASPDDEQALSTASLRLAQTKLYELVLRAEQVAEGGDLTDFLKVVREIGNMARASSTTAKTRREALSAAGAIAEQKAVAGGLTPDAAAAIRQHIEAEAEAA